MRSNADDAPGIDAMAIGIWLGTVFLADFCEATCASSGFAIADAVANDVLEESASFQIPGATWPYPNQILSLEDSSVLGP